MSSVGGGSTTVTKTGRSTAAGDGSAAVGGGEGDEWRAGTRRKGHVAPDIQLLRENARLQQELAEARDECKLLKELPEPERPERPSSLGYPDGGHLCSLPQASHRLSGALEKDCAMHMPQAPKVKHHRKELSVPETLGGFPATFVLATALDGSLEARAPCQHAAMQRTILKEKLLLRQTNPP
jgi:hypothetical protein